MRCAVHPDNEAIGVCVLCGAAVCVQCQRFVRGRILCLPCYSELRQGENPINQPQALLKPTAKRSGCLVFLLGLVPGLGHLYLGQIRKGLVLMGIVVLGFLFTFANPPHGGPLDFLFLAFLPLLVAYSAFDSVHTARRLNMGELIPDWDVNATVRQHLGINPSWSFFVGAALILIGGLLLLESMARWTDWFGELPPAIRLIGRNLLALGMVGGGGYLLWKTFRASANAS